MFSTNMSEKETGIVKIDDLRGEAFKVILNFIYSGAMDSSWAEYCEEVVYGAEKVKYYKKYYFTVNFQFVNLIDVFYFCVVQSTLAQIVL